MTPAALLAAFLEVLAFRMLPLLGYALLARHASPRRRWIAGALLLGLFGAASLSGVTATRLGWAALATAYVAASSLAVHGLAGLFGRGAITRAGLLSLVVYAYLVLPGLALPGEIAVYFLVLGWEVALAAYSYAIEGGKPSAKASVSECAFFLVVSPLLVYVPSSALAIREPGSCRRGLQRALGGALVMFVAIPLATPRALPFAETLARLDGYTAFLVNGVFVFVARYAALSGLASLHIGVMRVLGFELPERYDRPFLARNPADFWRRWNRYIGDWLKRYAFVPLSRELARARHRGMRSLARPLAIFATLLAIGVYHDAYVYASELHVRWSGTAAFAFAALVMTVWTLLPRAARWLWLRARLPALPAARPALRAAVGRAVILHGACALLWLFTRA